jgi:tetratricopeptide (TPR) repeat protein
MLIRIAGVFVAVFCGYAAYWSARWAWADWMMRSSVERALRLAPGNPDYYMRLAQAKPALALSALERAAELNPLSSPVWIELADAAEQHGDSPKAERCLLHAVALDKTFAPRWLLAECYSRRGDQAHFWPAVRTALATSYDDITPLFDLCWAFAPDPGIVQERALPERTDVWRQYFDFLLSKDRLEAAESIAGRIVAQATRDTVPSLLGYCDRLLEQNRGPRAVETWNSLVAKHLLDYPELAPSRGLSLTNGGFAKELLSHAFDWRVSQTDGVFFRQDDSPPGLWFEFSGNEPEQCELLSQYVPVEPGRPYRLVVSYSTEGLEGDTGIDWRVVDVQSKADLLRGGGHVMASERTEKAETYNFQTPADARLIKLVLAYNRALGTVRIKGSVSLRGVVLGFEP